MLIRFTTPFLLLATTALLLTPSQAQFSCTLSNTDEDSCLNAKGDDGKHCAWCDVSSFSFCASEDQAEKMEESLPGVKCDRYSGGDDDAAPKDDDAAPKDDDSVAPNDDSLPDDFWTCLQKKTEATCESASCTWCNSKAGWGLCMTGPTAESAANSTFFDCPKKYNDIDFEMDLLDEDVVANDVEEDDDERAIVKAADPTDTSCVLAYLQDPTAEGCEAAADMEGNACEYCTIGNGLANVCLTSEQAEMGQQLGVTCDATAQESWSSWLRGGKSKKLQDPLDPSCLMAFLQDPTEDGCKAAVDADGEGCEFCTFQGTPLCLNGEQAQMGEQMGMECDAKEMKALELLQANLEDPLDSACLMAFLQDPTEDGCKAAVDSDGAACEFCTFQGTPLCLNEEQAQMGEQFGMECDEDVDFDAIQDDADEKDPNPYDPSCAMAFLQNPTKDSCVEALDQDGESCKYCQLQGTLNLCLTEEQAEVGEGLGITCEEEEEGESKEDIEAATSSAFAMLQKELEDPLDSACLMAFLQDPTEDGCKAAVDSDGAACEFCTFQGNPLCLNEEQAQIGEQFGMECDEEGVVASVEDDESPSIPPDFFECLQNYDEHGCNTSSCTWCDTEVGMGFCMADAAARAMAECDFFSCDTRKKVGQLAEQI